MNSTNAARKIEVEGAAPLADLLRRVADELRAAARTVDAVPVSGEDARAAAEPRRRRLLTQAIQDLDHTCQKLSCLADFLNALAHSAPPHWALDPGPAASLITLAALAERLRSPDGIAAEPPEAGGDFELF